MKFILLNLFVILLMTCEAFARIHKRTEYFLDIELSKKQFLIDCSGGPKDDNSIVGFHLLEGDTYYLFYYRRVRTVKECHELRKEYMDMLKDYDTVRIVGNHPDESVMIDSERKGSPAPFNKAKKIVSSFFIRLHAGDKCKAYFSEDCDLPKNYWGGVTPGK
jgi:hypothetical protein